jgi:hypothetical protein
MPTVHIYVRTQVTATDAKAAQIAAWVEDMRYAVESAGGTWNGGVQIVPDAEVETNAAEVPTYNPVG